MNPGDTLEGHGQLWQQGRLVARVDYHLSIPRVTYFILNPTSTFQLDYETHLAGFILLALADTEKISLTEYTLELSDQTRKKIRVERCYKQMKHKGELRLSFWVKVV